MIQAGHDNLLKSDVKSNVKSKRATNIHEKQDLECPNQSITQKAEFIVADSSSIKIKNKENIKTGWGTDITFGPTSGNRNI